MHILNAYRCKHVCFWEYIILLCADEKSRDAKSCVSQARMRNKLRRLCACHYCGFCPGDARNAFITSISLYALYCHGLLVRRKILRLYKAGAIESVSIKSIIIPAVHQSRDAKFCVSQARMRNKQMRNMSVNAALFARETQGWAINKCDYIPGIAAFFARETQDFASLQG